jgi:hypothetical protein
MTTNYLKQPVTRPSCSALFTAAALSAAGNQNQDEPVL